MLEFPGTLLSVGVSLVTYIYVPTSVARYTCSPYHRPHSAFHDDQSNSSIGATY